jgi:CheY-like chemotaxis protein
MMAKKILVVDDELDILESVKMLVECIGYEVEIVDNGVKALNILKKEKFDLVLLDILMPKLSGIEVLKKIREDSKLKNQKVAFLTVVGLNQAGKDVVKKLHPADYIEKPIDNKIFKEKIKKMLGD